MKILGIDIGSSSVKAGVLRDGVRVLGTPARISYKTRNDGVKVEVDPAELLRAVAKAICAAIEAAGAQSVDAIAIAAMAPSWVAMDSRGQPLTPIVTHQDRRAVAEAHEIERRVGRARHLRLAGNRPFPGGISSTPWLWFMRHEPSRLRRADLVGHANTFLHRRLCGTRITDPSNASFTGLYSTLTLNGWNTELCDAIGVKQSLLPDVRDANEIAGRVTKESARRFGLVPGTPVLVGFVDTSSAMLLAGHCVGQWINSCGSTDVLAVCTDSPRPHERLLTRALGVGKRWMSVSTLAAGGSTMQWMKDHLFADTSWPAFTKRVIKLAQTPIESSVRFAPYLAGDRASIEQPSASFTGLTLSTSRETMLSAAIESLAAASAARIDLLRETNRTIRLSRDVCLTGGADATIRRILHRDWPGRWRFREQSNATLRGLWHLADGAIAAVGSFRGKA